VEAWIKFATGDVHLIKRWFFDHPFCSLGLTRQPSGAVVVDENPRSGGDLSIGKLGQSSVYSLIQNVSATSGECLVIGKAMHRPHRIFLLAPNEAFFGSLSVQGQQGIDVKHKAHIVVSPSRNFSGVSYGREQGHVP
jgi:hypothetical protein